MDRLNSAKLSGFKSSDSIYRMITNVLIEKRNNNFKTILDFGAGKGNLLNIIMELNLFEEFHGADIIPKPKHLQEHIKWIQMDLNDSFNVNQHINYDVIIACEILEHLENPRHAFKQFYNLLNKNGMLIISTPNNHSIRSIVNYIFRGHFTDFLDDSYPAHITPIIMKDLTRYASEIYFSVPQFYFSNNGCVPAFLKYKWQQISFGLLKGRLYSDNLAALFTKI